MTEEKDENSQQIINQRMKFYVDQPQPNKVKISWNTKNDVMTDDSRNAAPGDGCERSINGAQVAADVLMKSGTVKDIAEPENGEHGGVNGLLLEPDLSMANYSTEMDLMFYLQENPSPKTSPEFEVLLTDAGESRSSCMSASGSRRRAMTNSTVRSDDISSTTQHRKRKRRKPTLVGISNSRKCVIASRSEHAESGGHFQSKASNIESLKFLFGDEAEGLLISNKNSTGPNAEASPKENAPSNTERCLDWRESANTKSECESVNNANSRNADNENVTSLENALNSSCEANDDVGPIRDEKASTNTHGGCRENDESIDNDLSQNNNHTRQKKFFSQATTTETLPLMASEESERVVPQNQVQPCRLQVSLGCCVTIGPKAPQKRHLGKCCKAFTSGVAGVAVVGLAFVVVVLEIRMRWGCYPVNHPT